MSDLREFKADVREALAALPGAPVGFSYGDLARRLGDRYRGAGKDQERLRRFIFNHIEKGLLVRLGHGRYAAGARFAEENALGVGVQLVTDIREAFFDAGGVMPLTTLLSELGRTGTYDATHVRTVLDASPHYQSGLPFAGHRRDWWMVDSERLKVPVPGRLLALELQMAASGRGAGDLPRRLRRRRAQISAAIAEAREINEMAVEEITAIPAVANALEWGMLASDIPCSPGAFTGTIAGWWAQRTQDGGRAVALADAWRLLETEGAPHIMTTSVALWCAVGEALGLSAPHLSRGCVTRLR